MTWAEEEFEILIHRQWPEREFDKLGYLKIKGARHLDPKALAILRELYLTRDKHARILDRPPFKIIGNRALLDIAEANPSDLEALAKVKGVSGFLLRRMGKQFFTAVQKGNEKDHGPIPKRVSSGRRRMDRQMEHRLVKLKKWRIQRAEETALDPGILCPNSCLEAIAFQGPKRVTDLKELDEVKTWFRKEFGREVVDLMSSGEAPS